MESPEGSGGAAPGSVLPPTLHPYPALHRRCCCHAQVYAQLDRCRAYPDFNNYLAFIFASGEGLPIEVRQSAGLLLKNNLRAHYASIAEDFRAFIRAALLPVLGHTSRPLRHTAGTCAVTIVNHTGLGAWPELVAALAEGLDAGADANRVEGALDLVFKVREGVAYAAQPCRLSAGALRMASSGCRWTLQQPSMPLTLQAPTARPCRAAQIAEDQPLQLDAAMPGGGGRAADVLVPRVLALMGASAAELRALAVSTLNQLANIMPAALMDNMDRCEPAPCAVGFREMREAGSSRQRSSNSCWAAAAVVAGGDGGRFASGCSICELPAHLPPPLPPPPPPRAPPQVPAGPLHAGAGRVGGGAQGGVPGPGGHAAGGAGASGALAARLDRVHAQEHAGRRWWGSVCVCVWGGGAVGGQKG
jgi:hypothetical protein